MGFKLLICLLLMLMKVSENKNLPADFPRCHRSDQFLNKCMLQAMETVRPFIAKGIPEINLPPFEPLFVKGFEVDRDTEALRIKANLTNVFVHGLTNYDCRTFEFRVPSLQFATRCSFKEVKLVSDYTISGSVLGAQIEGTGNLTAIFGDGEANFTEIVKIVRKKRVEYLRVHETKISIGVPKISVRLDGLFDGNKELGDRTNKLLNDNIDEIFRQVTPFFEGLLTNVVDNLLLKAFSQVPYDELFPK